jgi:hypothetical protein
MSVLDAFLSTWSNARSTFGDGAPQTGAQYNSSGKLSDMSRWPFGGRLRYPRWPASTPLIVFLN